MSLKDLINDGFRQAAREPADRDVFIENLVAQLQETIQEQIRLLRVAPVRDHSKILDTINSLTKLYLLLTGEATERRETVNTLTQQINVKVMVEELKELLSSEGEEKDLNYLDTVAFEVLDDGEEDTERSS
jgi:tRNA U38,U39,U40 pseudouridine synthase TruA